MSGMTDGALARLAFWARGMTAIRDGHMEWPGFSYTEVEWARMTTLAKPIGGGTYQLFTLVNAAIFIAIASLGIFCVFLPLATLLFPVPAETSALKFSLLLVGMRLADHRHRLADFAASLDRAGRAEGNAGRACRRARRPDACGKSVMADQPDHARALRPAGAGHSSVHRLRHRCRPGHRGNEMAGDRVDGGFGCDRRMAAAQTILIAPIRDQSERYAPALRSGLVHVLRPSASLPPGSPTTRSRPVDLAL